MQKIGKKNKMRKKKERNKIWVVGWKTKDPINAVSAWAVYMYFHLCEDAPPPSTVSTTPPPHTPT